MFGLEDQKKKKGTEPFVFDLEKELKDPKSASALKQRIEERVQDIKATLRAGESKEEFDEFGILLHGYAALLKVLGKVTSKTK